MYHRIQPPNSDSSLVVSPESFSRQIDWLEKRPFQFFSLDEVVDRKGKIPIGDRSVALTFDDGFRDNFENGFSLLMARKRTAALFVVVNWVGQEGFLRWEEIQELANAGFTIGSHSLTHRWLPDLTDSEELRSEVFDSKKKIEDKIGRPVKHFSYPVGGVDQRVADLVKEAGYVAGWVAGARPSIIVKDSLLSLRRIKVTPSDSNPSLFAIKAYGIKGLFQ